VNQTRTFPAFTSGSGRPIVAVISGCLILVTSRSGNLSGKQAAGTSFGSLEDATIPAAVGPFQ
jgi:hypothetical protein